jgi:hypothetical protein
VKYNLFTKLRRKVFAVTAILIVLVAGVAIYQRVRPQPLIPNDIAKKVAFRISVPASPYKLDRSSVTYDTKQGVLSFKVKSVDNTIYTVSEQATPDVFSASNQVYPALLQKLHEYSEVQTSRGTVALTLPQELNGAQSAVINNSGVLMFARPSKKLTNSEWVQFMNQFENI